MILRTTGNQTTAELSVEEALEIIGQLANDIRTAQKFGHGVSGVPAKLDLGADVAAPHALRFLVRKI